jgi:hypothetical protein
VKVNLGGETPAYVEQGSFDTVLKKEMTKKVLMWSAPLTKNGHIWLFEVLVLPLLKRIFL